MTAQIGFDLVEMMITAQRRKLILEYLREHGGGSIVEIAAMLGSSRSSVRRDLDHLAGLGSITRSRGGAVLDSNPLTTFEPPGKLRAATFQAEKMSIGRAAADLVETGQSVIFDSSTTVREAAKAVGMRDMAVTACTNDLEVAIALANRANIQVIVLGGTLRLGSPTIVGEPASSFLGKLHADIALVGIHSVADGRLSETSVEVSTIKRQMIKCAGRVAVLADSTKFEHPAFCEVCPLHEIDVVVSDSGLSDSAAEQVRECGAELVVAEVEA
ncbi:MAG: DeoR/GlpR family DNA-binding transcription regulator [Albidovulum sp.]|nr:DeoR/GlpR family DNA-binding transcription regulator [Albidovulum sp.]